MIRQIMNQELTDSQKEYISWESDVCKGLLNTIDKAIVDGKNKVGLPHWAEQDPKVVKNFSFMWTHMGYGKVDISKKYAALEIAISKLPVKEILEYRTNKKLKKLLMRSNTKKGTSTNVRVNGKTMETGLIRNGFAKVATYEFKFDIEQMQRYYNAISLNLIKGMKKAKELGKVKDHYLNDEANFEKIAKYALDHYMLDGKYSLEANTSDSRGRSVYKALKRIANPVSNKDFRAMLVMEPPMLVNRTNKDQMDDIYYFIAELTSSKATTEEGKIQDGIDMYSNHTLPELDLDTAHDRDELHELIWLERIYTKLDSLLRGNLQSCVWDIPLEVDASMSVAQIVGALTGDERLLNRTNVIGDTLTDPWFIEGVPRLSAKSVGTPVFYGSSKSAESLLKSKGLAASKDELKAIKKEFNTGGLSIIRMFKDAIIKNYTKHEPVIPVKIWNDTFDVHVNKFKSAGSTIVVTEAWNGKKYKLAYTHKPNFVPDYSYMKLFWATCLV